MNRSIDGLFWGLERLNRARKIRVPFSAELSIVEKRGKEGQFAIGIHDGYTRDWLESHLSSTVTRFLTGICNWPVQDRFVNINDMS